MSDVKYISVPDYKQVQSSLWIPDWPRNIAVPLADDVVSMKSNWSRRNRHSTSSKRSGQKFYPRFNEIDIPKDNVKDELERRKHRSSMDKIPLDVKSTFSQTAL